MNKLLLLLLGVFFISTAHRPVAQKINWMTWQQAQEAQKQHPKKIFVDVYTEWCGWCKRMDATTFSNAEIIKYMNENYYAVKFDAEQKEPILFNGKEYKFVPQGGRGYHELAAYLMNNKMSYPTTLYLDEKLELLTPLPGYQEPPMLETVLNYFGSNAYKTTKWEDFDANFQGKL
jgi:thioredoxin-related protein